MRGRRIFLGIDISDAAREACVRHVEELRGRFPGARVGWERPEKMHVTLKFLGDTTDDILGQLGEKIGEVVRGQTEFPTSLLRTGVFPNQSRPRIIWVGLGDSQQRLEQMHRSIEAICAEFGYEKDTKRFTPHITTGRVREPQSASALARVHLETEIEPVEFSVSKVVIYESKLQATGSVYSSLSGIPLGGV